MVTPATAEALGHRGDVVDPEVEQRWGSASFEEQAAGAEVEEGEPGRIEPSDAAERDGIAVEGDSTVEVLDVLSDLSEVGDAHGAEE